MKRLMILAAFWACAAVWAAASAGAQTIPADSLAADWRQLVGYVEQTHPDPYTAFGGRVFFGLAAQKTGDDIVSGALTREDFVDRANAFLATLHDGHTFVYGVPGGVDAQTMRYPLHARVTTGGLIVTGIAAEHRELIGARIVSVAGLAVEEIAERAATMQAVENDFGALNAVGQRLFLLDAVRRMTSGTAGATVEMTFEMPGGERLHAAFGEMLRRMRDEKMPHLIIDLRGNGGGMTPIVHQTLYQMYGERFLPDDDPRAKVFWPETTLSPERLAEYDFDENSEILYLCDILSGRRNMP